MKTKKIILLLGLFFSLFNYSEAQTLTKDTINSKQTQIVIYDGIGDRQIIKPPTGLTNLYDVGIVTVKITIDNEGNVTKADPGQRGTTTTSSILWAKARKAALETKFNKSATGLKEQTGIIGFHFTLDK